MREHTDTHIVSVCQAPAPQALARHTALAHLDVCRVTYVSIGTRSLSPCTLSREWDDWPKDLPFESVTLFDQALEEVPCRLQRRAVRGVMETLRPTDLFCLGYDLPVMRAAARCARRVGARTYVFFETCERDQPRIWWKERAKRLLLPRLYDGAFVGGQLHRDYVLKLGFPPKYVVMGGSVIDNDHFARGAQEARAAANGLRAELGLPERYFLFVGRLHPEKNPVRLLQSYAAYRRRMEDGWGLVIVGSGGLREELQARAHELRLPELSFVAFQQPDEIPKYYGLASCLILPSVWEPWGLVVNEALACGLPVLLSRICGCLPDLLREGQNGFSFDPLDVEEMADCMVRVCEGELGAESVARVSAELIEPYSPGNWARNLLSLVESVRGRRGEP